MTDVIDAVMAEIEPTETVETPQDATETEASKEDPEKESDGADESRWPKKADNALKRKNNQLRQLRWERRQYERELTELRELKASSQPKEKSNERPKESDFTSVIDFLQADSDWKLEQFKSTIAPKQQDPEESAKASQANQSRVTRDQELDHQAAEFFKSVPDAQTVIAQARNIVAAFPPHLKEILREAENPTLAIYNLAQEDALEDLEDMSPARAAMIIGAAQKALPTKTTNAPAPMASAKGRSSSKSPENMDTDALLKWVYAR